MADEGVRVTNKCDLVIHVMRAVRSITPLDANLTLMWIENVDALAVT